MFEYKAWLGEGRGAPQRDQIERMEAALADVTARRDASESELQAARDEVKRADRGDRLAKRWAGLCQEMRSGGLGDAELAQKIKGLVARSTAAHDSRRQCCQEYAQWLDEGRGAPQRDQVERMEAALADVTARGDASESELQAALGEAERADAGDRLAKRWAGLCKEMRSGAFGDEGLVQEIKSLVKKGRQLEIEELAAFVAEHGRLPRRLSQGSRPWTQLQALENRFFL